MKTKMHEAPLLYVAAVTAISFCLLACQPPKKRIGPHGRIVTETKVAQCSVPMGNGYANIVGSVKAFYTKEGNSIHVTIAEYRIEHADTDRNKANINLSLSSWSGPHATGKQADFSALSPDAMRQDGQWHALNLAAGGDARFDVKGASLGAEFVFDMAGSDKKCQAGYIPADF